MATVSKKTATPAAPNAETVASAKAKIEKTAKAERQDGESAFAFAGAAQDQYAALMKTLGVNSEELQGRTQEMMDASRESFETAQSHFQDASAQMMEAARQEMSDVVDFANELTRARTVSDAFEIQRDYWTRLFETRADRARAMAQSSVDAIRETTEPMQRTMKGAFAEPAFGNMSAFFPFAKK